MSEAPKAADRAGANSLGTAVIGTIAAVLTAVLIGWAGSQHGQTLAGWPVFALCGMLAFAVQWIVFVHAWTQQTEHFFDLTGSLTYCTLLLIALLATDPTHWRSVLLTGLILIWALRLGPFLFKRIQAAGEDRRFRSIKVYFPTFFMTWTLQGLWVFITAACALAAITGQKNVELGGWAAIGLLLWIAGLTIEVIADRQKSAFRAQDKDGFITTGLWAWSRHPNYFGEIVLWLGIALIALPELQGWQYATLISPLFVVVLLTMISGVRMLESRGKKRWGDDPEYQRYLASTPVLIPMPPKGTS